jgi:hypothetical protein
LVGSTPYRPEGRQGRTLFREPQARLLRPRRGEALLRFLHSLGFGFNAGQDMALELLGDCAQRDGGGGEVLGTFCKRWFV